MAPAAPCWAATWRRTHYCGIATGLIFGNQRKIGQRRSASRRDTARNGAVARELDCSSRHSDPCGGPRGLLPDRRSPAGCPPRWAGIADGMPAFAGLELARSLHRYSSLTDSEIVYYRTGERSAVMREILPAAAPTSAAPNLVTPESRQKCCQRRSHAMPGELSAGLLRGGIALPCRDAVAVATARPRESTASWPIRGPEQCNGR